MTFTLTNCASSITEWRSRVVGTTLTWFEYDITSFDTVEGTYTFPIIDCAARPESPWTQFSESFYLLNLGDRTVQRTQYESVGGCPSGIPFIANITLNVSLAYQTFTFNSQESLFSAHTMLVNYHDKDLNVFFTGSFRSGYSSVNRTNENTCGTSLIRYLTSVPICFGYSPVETGIGSTAESIL